MTSLQLPAPPNILVTGPEDSLPCLTPGPRARWGRVLPLISEKKSGSGLQLRRESITSKPPLSSRAKDNAVLQAGLRFLNLTARQRHRQHLRHNTLKKAPSRHDLSRLNVARAWTHHLTPLQRFRRVGSIVRILCAVCLALRKYALEAGYLDSYMVTVTTRKTRQGLTSGKVEELSFNLRDYKAKKELPLPWSTIRLMNKNPEDRTEADLEVISRIMRSLPSFRKYTRHMQWMFCRIVRYMKVGKRRVVLRKGHIGYCLYFVYTGAVSVVLDKDDGSVFVKAEVVLLKRGACFGEIALIKDTPRMATVVCAEETEFLFIDKEDFINNRLDRQMREEFNQRYNFFRFWPPMQDWDDEDIKQLSFVSRSEEVGYNKVIIPNSTRNEWLWFIVKGSCDLMRVVDLERHSGFQGTLLSRTAGQFVTGSKKNDPVPAGTSRSVSARPVSRRTKPRTRRPNTCPGNPLSNQPPGGGTGALTPPGGTARAQTPPAGKVTQTAASDSSDAESEISITKNARVTVVQPILDANKNQPDVGTGIYVKLDTLRDGQCFGLEEIYHQSLGLSLVSKGCELIQVPRAKFCEMADDNTLRRMRGMAKSYPPDSDLCRMFLDRNQWDNYKQNVVEEVVTAHARPEFHNGGLRDVCRPNSRYHYGDGYKKMQNPEPEMDLPSATRASSSLTGNRSQAASPTHKEPVSRHRPRTCPARAARSARMSAPPPGSTGSGREKSGLSPNVKPVRHPGDHTASKPRSPTSPRTLSAPRPANNPRREFGKARRSRTPSPSALHVPDTPSPTTLQVPGPEARRACKVEKATVLLRKNSFGQNPPSKMAAVPDKDVTPVKVT